MRRRESLASVVARDLAEQIESGVYGVGDQIPIEAALCERYNVSRTVVREAIASLRSEGLLLSRQGIGVFVAATRGNVPFKLEAGTAPELAEIIDILELRIGVEVEACGLAALRRSAADLVQIGEILEQGAHYGEVDDGMGEIDFSFHLAIASASKNGYFSQFLRFLGPVIIPRNRLRASYTGDEQKRDYLKKIHEEHTRIAWAIENQDVLDARDAMRLHLSGSLDRYRKLNKAAHLIS